MDNIIIVNKKTFKDPGDGIVIPVHRPSPLGNPFFLKDVNDDDKRNYVCDQYDNWLKRRITENNSSIMKELNRIIEHVRTGKTVYLICFCAPKRCHAESIKKRINNLI